MKRLVGLALLLGLATPAPAESPPGEARPLPRPDIAASAAPASVTRSDAPSDTSSVRPPPRPGPLAGLVPAQSEPGRRPHPRPGQVARPVAGEALAQSVRPPARPPEALRVPVVVQVAARLSHLPRQAGIAPPERPENLQRLSQAVALRPVAYPDPGGARGSVCGIASIRGTALATIPGSARGCGLKDGVKVTAVGGLALSTPASIDCTTARALHNWIETGLKPAVGNLGGGVARLEVAASYACRPRNNRKGGRISEHGKGRAIDIAAIVLRNGTTLSVLDGWHSASQGKVLRRIHKAACGPFNTTLGPGSDGYHENHFHFDTARGRGPYCH